MDEKLLDEHNTLQYPLTVSATNKETEMQKFWMAGETDNDETVDMDEVSKQDAEDTEIDDDIDEESDEEDSDIDEVEDESSDD